MAVGGLPEKLLTALQPVLDEHATEEGALNKCSVAARYVGKIEEDVENNLTQGKSYYLLLSSLIMHQRTSSQNVTGLILKVQSLFSKFGISILCFFFYHSIRHSLVSSSVWESCTGRGWHVDWKISVV